MAPRSPHHTGSDGNGGTSAGCRGQSASGAVRIVVEEHVVKRSDITVLLTVAGTEGSGREAAAAQDVQGQKDQQHAATGGEVMGASGVEPAAAATTAAPPAAPAAAPAAAPEPAAALPEPVCVPAHALILETASAYFATCLDTEVGTARSDSSGKRQLVVELEDEDHVRAAEAVLEAMYTKQVPAACTANPQQLALMCRIADRWQASKCLGLAFTALASMQASLLSVEAAAAALDVLPECVLQHPAHAQWHTLCFTTLTNGITAGVDTRRLLLALLGDVHQVLTSQSLLSLLQQLPFKAMLAWVGSDELVVDSENSVVVALDCWVRGKGGKQYSNAELQQVSSNVRVKHLTLGYKLRLLELPWWPQSKKLTRWVVLGTSTQSFMGRANVIPSGWLALPRKQLPAHVLQERTSITWDVPRAHLKELLSKAAVSRINSPAVYVAGHSVCLGMQIGEASSASRELGVFLYNTTYSAGVEVVPTGDGSPFVLTDYSTSYVTPSAEPKNIYTTSSRVLMTNGWGVADAFTASSITDLDPHLVDGHLKLRATFTALLSS